VVAGIAEMRYASFVTYNIVGGIGWVFGMVLTGYFLASLVPNIEERIHWVIAVVIILSFLPPIIGALRSRRGSKPPGAGTIPLSPSQQE
jgi:membrane-associated protein